MTPPPVPGLGPAIASVFRLQVRRLVRGRKVRLGATAAVLVLLGVVGASYAATAADPTQVVEAGVEWGFFSMLVLLVPFLFNSGAIAEDVEARTFTYLAVRPAGRFAVTAGKYLAGASLSIGLLAGTLLLVHVAAYAADPTAMFEQLTPTLRTLGALTLLALYYSGVCLFWGAVAPEAAGIVAALHLALSFLFGAMPGIFRLVSMNYLARQVAGLPKGGLMASFVPDVPTAAAAAVVGTMAIVALALAVLVVRISEYRFGKA